jgi:glycosyltransferase involved in cell wall biosynthesis
MELSVVIPAFNEAATIGGVVAGHRAVALELASTFEILVCDDGSVDATWSSLEAASRSAPELRLFRHPANLGIPPTMKRLYAEARGTWIYFAPADGQVPAEALRIMWSAREGAALVVGRRIPRRDPTSRVLIAQLYSALLWALFRLPVRDVDSVKLYRADELRRTVTRSESNFFEAEILIGLCRRGATVREIVIPHRPRVAGRAKGVTPRSALLAAKDVALFAMADALRQRR